MLTLALSFINDCDWQEVIGIILTVIEVILILIKFLQYFVDPKSKFGVFLANCLKGITFVKDEVQKNRPDDDDESKTD